MTNRRGSTILPRCSADGKTGHLARLVRVVLRVADLRAVVFLGDRLAVVFALLVRFFVLRDAAVFRVVVFLAVDRFVDRVAFFAVVLRLVAALVDRFFVVRVADDFFGDRFAVAFFVVRLLAVVFLVDRLAVVALVERFVPVVFLDAALRVVAMEYDSSSTFSNPKNTLLPNVQEAGLGSAARNDRPLVRRRIYNGNRFRCRPPVALKQLSPYFVKSNAATFVHLIKRNSRAPLRYHAMDVLPAGTANGFPNECVSCTIYQRCH